MGTHLHWSDAVYCACDAKFRAEYASDVGKQTSLAVYEYDEEISMVSPLRIDESIRTTWERSGAHRVPPSMEKILPGIVYKPSQLFTEEGWDRFLGKAPRNKDSRNQYRRREYQALRRAMMYRNKAAKGAEENP